MLLRASLERRFASRTCFHDTSASQSKSIDTHNWDTLAHTHTRSFSCLQDDSNFNQSLTECESWNEEEKKNTSRINLPFWLWFFSCYLNLSHHSGACVICVFIVDRLKSFEIAQQFKSHTHKITPPNEENPYRWNTWFHFNCGGKTSSLAVEWF